MPETDHLHRCQSSPKLFKQCLPYPLSEVLLCYCWHCWAVAPMCLPVDNMDSHLNVCCLSYWPCLPCGFTLFSVCGLADLLYRLCLWICLADVALDTVDWALPVWLLLCINKAAQGSQRHWPFITNSVFSFLGWTVHLIFGQNNNFTIFDYIFKIITIFSKLTSW